MARRVKHPASAQGTNHFRPAPLICIKAIPAYPISLQKMDRVKAMQQMCQQFWPCSVVPPDYLWLMPIILPLLAIVLVGIPVATILHRAGRSRWWTLIAFIPVLNLIGLWVFAFSRWSTVDRASA
jgi:uncharacterized membrane protein YhaH (DUF805 family)